MPITIPRSGSATSGDRFTVDVATLDGAAAGRMASFDYASGYSWTLATAAGGAGYGVFVLDAETNIRSIRHRDTLNAGDNWVWNPASGQPVPVVGSLQVGAVV